MLPLAIPAYVLAFVQMGIFEYAGPVQSFVRDVMGNSRWFPDIRGSLWGWSWCWSWPSTPMYLMARSAFLTQGHRSMEAAQALGYSPVAAFFKVALPLARPWIGAGLALVLMEVLADFGAIAVFNFDTFSTAVYKSWFDLHNIGAAAQLAAILVLVVLLLVAAEQRSRNAKRFHVSNPQQHRAVLQGACAGWHLGSACWCLLRRLPFPWCRWWPGYCRFGVNSSIATIGATPGIPCIWPC